MDMMMNMSMSMAFKFSDHLSPFLFKKISIHSGAGIFVACVVIAAFAILIEGIKLWRATLQKQDNMNPLTYGQTEQNISERSPLVAPLLIPASASQIKRRRLKYHTLQTFAYVCQVITGYILMLAVMTYNAWILIAVALASGLGYFLFGALRDYILSSSDKSSPVVQPSSQEEDAERMRLVAGRDSDYDTYGAMSGHREDS